VVACARAVLRAAVAFFVDVALSSGGALPTLSTTFTPSASSLSVAVPVSCESLRPSIVISSGPPAGLASGWVALPRLRPALLLRCSWLLEPARGRAQAARREASANLRNWPGAPKSARSTASKRE
jgi:hypothetical protein